MIILRLDDAIIKSLTNNELNILKYVYAHTDDILNMSIHELAKQVSYSSATILRFCKKLGYSGYAEFKYELYKETKRSKSDVRAPKESAFSIQMIMNSLSSNV
ncbi:MAG: MurR/RpiR family transcriptional regulator, partial [Lachnospiraceae bacterium]|nr:MurR/RpiR family transcriptional regulator [Lachnospiraceae bacterium]